MRIIIDDPEADREQALYVRELLERGVKLLDAQIADKGELTVFTNPRRSAMNVINQIDEQLGIGEPYEGPRREVEIEAVDFGLGVVA